MHKTVSKLARQGIDDEVNQIIKEETDQPPLPSSNPLLDHQLAQAKKPKSKQAELDAGFQIALKYLGRGIIEDLQSSPSLPKTVNGMLELAEITHMEPIDADHLAEDRVPTFGIAGDGEGMTVVGCDDDQRFCRVRLLER